MKRMTAEQREQWRVRDDQCDVLLSERLLDDAACLLPIPCPHHGDRSDEADALPLAREYAEGQICYRTTSPAAFRNALVRAFVAGARTATAAEVVARLEVLADELDDIDGEAWAVLGGVSLGGAIRHALRDTP